MCRSSSVSALACVVGITISVSGCGHTVNKAAVAKIKKIGIVSLSVDRVGSTPGDDEVMQAVAEFAAKSFVSKIGPSLGWQVVDWNEYREDPSYKGFSDFATSDIVLKHLEKMSDDGDLPPADPKAAFKMLTGGFSHRENAKTTAAGYAKVFAQLHDKYITAPGMPLVPYQVLRPEGGAKKFSYKGGNASQKDPKEIFRDATVGCIGALAKKMGVDAMAVIWMHTGIKSTVGVGLRTGDRGRDSLKMDPAMALISKDGELIVESGWPGLDAMATSSMAVPVYKVEYVEGGKHKDKDDRRFNFVIDLKDPEGQVLAEYKNLVAEATDEFIADLKKLLDIKGKPKAAPAATDDTKGSEPSSESADGSAPADTTTTDSEGAAAPGDAGPSENTAESDSAADSAQPAAGDESAQEAASEETPQPAEPAKTKRKKRKKR